MTELPATVDVVVVGAGPTGLVAACKLRQQGCTVAVFDSAAEPRTTSRAVIVHSKTLEELESLNITHRIIETGKKINVSIRTPSRELALLDFSRLKARYPMMISLPQAETERFLTEKLHELGGCVYRNHKVTHFDQNDVGVTIEVQNNHTGDISTITSEYVIAADGFHGSIRQALNISSDGGEYKQSFALADCEISSWPLDGDVAPIFLTGDGFLLCVPLPDGLWRVAASMDDAPPTLAIADVQELINQRGVKGAKVEAVPWSSRFRIHRRLARSFRKNRVFLCGDAAHVHSPAGAQGMNIGIQDGLEAATVIGGALLGGRNSARDLDRYEERRRPVAKGVIALTHRLTVFVTLRHPLLVRLRNMFIRFVIGWGVRMRLTRRLAELD